MTQTTIPTPEQISALTNEQIVAATQAWEQVRDTEQYLSGRAAVTRAVGDPADLPELSSEVAALAALEQAVNDRFDGLPSKEMEGLDSSTRWAYLAHAHPDVLSDAQQKALLAGWNAALAPTASRNSEGSYWPLSLTGPAPQTAWELQHTAAVAALTGAYRAGIDMGEFICHVVTAAAANAGGAEALLSVRTGSWEAGYVRNIVESTAGDAIDHLAAYRTEPVRIYLPAEALYDELGLYNLLHEEGDQNMVPIHDAYDALPSDLHEPLPGPVNGWAKSGAGMRMRLREDLSDDVRAQLTAIHQLEEQEDQHFARMEALYEADVAAYRANLRVALINQLAANGLQDVAFEIVEDTHPLDGPYSDLGDLLTEIEEAAAQRVIVPPLGRPRAEIKGSVVDAVRAAGLTYTERDAGGERAPQTNEETNR